MQFCKVVFHQFIDENDHDSSSPFSLINYPNPIDNGLDLKWFANSPLPLIKWAIEDGCKSNGTFEEYLCWFGRLNVLTEIKKEGFTVSSRAIFYAINRKHFHVAKWLWFHIKRYPEHPEYDKTNDEEILASAVRSENLKMLRWLTNKGIKPTIKHVDSALTTGNIKVINFIDRFIKYSEEGMNDFYYWCKVSSIQWLEEHGYVVNFNKVKYYSLRYQRIETLKWLRDVKEIAFTSEDLQIHPPPYAESLEWLHEHLGMPKPEKEKVIDMDAIRKLGPTPTKRQLASILPWEVDPFVY